MPVFEMTTDVPSLIDLCLMSDALEWEAAALRKRPCRREFFAKFSEAIAAMGTPAAHVLKLGSGPGFLADRLLRDLPYLRMTLFDYSEAMHVLAAKRLVTLRDRVEFRVGNSKAHDWCEGFESFDAVVTNQAVHELRHKRYAVKLHSEVATILRLGGKYLVCDHFAGPGGMANHELYMTPSEQRSAIESAGFESVTQALLTGGMVLHESTISGRR